MINELPNTLKEYLEYKFKELYGSGFEKSPQYLKEMENKTSQFVQLEVVPSKWDLGIIIHIMLAFSDAKVMQDDIIMDEWDNLPKLRRRFQDIKTLRNKICHNTELDAREIYDSLSNIQTYFEMFKEGLNNPISKNKLKYVDYINTKRLQILE